MKIRVTYMLALACLALAACSTTRTVVVHEPATTPAAAATSAQATAASCSFINGDLDQVVTDLKTQDANEQEAWVSGGDSMDLQALINDTATAASGADPLSTDEATFNSDASDYLSTNDPALAPGWEADYSTLTDDINSLARDCNRALAPENLPQGGTAPASP